MIRMQQQPGRQFNVTSYRVQATLERLAERGLDINDFFALSTPSTDDALVVLGQIAAFVLSLDKDSMMFSDAENDASK